MTNEDTQYTESAKTDKAEAIRKRYCLENNQVFESLDDDFTYREKEDSGDTYLIFDNSELDTIHYKNKLYFIKRIK